MHGSDSWLAQLCQETDHRPGALFMGSADTHGYVAEGNCLLIPAFPVFLSLHALAKVYKWSAVCRQCHLQAAMLSPSDMPVAVALLPRGHRHPQTHM